MTKENLHARLTLDCKNLFFFFVLLGMLLLESCKSKQPNETPSFNSSDSTVAPAENETQVTPMPTDVIVYNGAVSDETKTTMETFSPFVPISSLASYVFHIKDSILGVRQTQDFLDPKDTLILTPYKVSTYKAILAYKKKMSSGPSLKGGCPSLLQLTRTTGSEDSTIRNLPSIAESHFLAHGDFFFLGGAPFIYQCRPDDNTVYRDSNGNPETRFESNLSENGNFLLTSLYHFKNIPTTIAYGPPLRSYDSGPKEINGIGSLIHNFVERVPVLFLTEKGIVHAHLISVTLKLSPEYLGCISDQPRIEFACSKNIGEQDILGVYIPYQSAPINSCKVSRDGSSLWTADLNNDGDPDIACVSATFEGVASGERMAESLWYVNINGKWKIIDWARTLDCT